MTQIPELVEKVGCTIAESIVDDNWDEALRAASDLLLLIHRLKLEREHGDHVAK